MFYSFETTMLLELLWRIGLTLKQLKEKNLFTEIIMTRQHIFYSNFSFWDTLMRCISHLNEDIWMTIVKFDYEMQ